MNDIEYARLIYCKVFAVGDDGGDAYICGIMNEISLLNVKEQCALDYYYRQNQTFARIGKTLGGISRQGTSNILRNVLNKLRQPLIMRNMSITATIEYKDKLLSEAREQIKILQLQLVDMVQRDSYVHGENGEPEAIINKTALSKLNLTTRVYNLLKNVGIDSVESILVLDNLDVLVKKRNFGIKARDEIIIKMHSQGYTEWAEHIKKYYGK